MVIVLGGEPYQVLSTHVFRKQQRRPVNQTKLKHLVTGKVVEQTFQQSDNIEEADVSRKQIKYIFHKYNRQTSSEEFWFSDKDNPGDRFMLNADTVGDQHLYMRENELVEALLFEDKIVSVSVPIKVTLKVSEAPPNVRGNTAQGGTKQVTLETGAVVSTPMFIEAGDVIEINTESGEYVRRIE